MTRHPWELPGNAAESLSETLASKAVGAGRRIGVPNSAFQSAGQQLERGVPLAGGRIHSATQQLRAKAGLAHPGFHSAGQQLAGRHAPTEGIRDHVRRFREENALIEFLEEHVGQGAFQRVAATNGGEWAGPCPVCGGDDRLRAWPDPREGNPRAWCRKCGRAGDVLDWAAWVAGRDPKCHGAVVQTLRDAGQLGVEERMSRRAPQIAPTTPPISLSNSATPIARQNVDALVEPLPRRVSAWPADAREHFEERAAIMEYDGGLTRAEAERRAEAEVRAAVREPRVDTTRGPA